MQVVCLYKKLNNSSGNIFSSIFIISKYIVWGYYQDREILSSRQDTTGKGNSRPIPLMKVDTKTLKTVQAN